jgi:hypothetical protein
MRKPAENDMKELNLIEILGFPAHFFDQQVQPVRVIVVLVS